MPTGHSATFTGDFFFLFFSFILCWTKKMNKKCNTLEGRHRLKINQKQKRREGQTRVKKVDCCSETSVLQCDPKCEIQASRNV